MIDLLGQELAIAEEQLTRAKISFDVVQTAPPGKELLEGVWRIVKQEDISGRYRLTVCRVPDPFR